uniref:Gx transporter family protein n=1 Tax=Clostridium sp. NkU-1 TaxID=1095009 RepID=UPI003261A335
MIPISLGIPGVKLGLANLVTIMGLYTVGTGGTVFISLLRIVLTGFTFGNLFAMLYSLGGWSLSLLIMVLCKRKKLDGYNRNQYSGRCGS